MAPGKPKDGEGKLGSGTAEGKVGKLLICSLFRKKKDIEIQIHNKQSVAKQEVLLIITPEPF